MYTIDELISRFVLNQSFLFIQDQDVEEICNKIIEEWQTFQGAPSKTCQQDGKIEIMYYFNNYGISDILQNMNMGFKRVYF